MFSKTPILLLTALTLFTSTAVTIPANVSFTQSQRPNAASGHTPIAFNSTNSTDSLGSTFSSRSKLEARGRDDVVCYDFKDKQRIFLTHDLAYISPWLQDEERAGKDQDLSMPHETWKRAWMKETMELCVENDYLFKSTHVSNREMGKIAQEILETCCHGEWCMGGRKRGHGDTGLEVYIMVKKWDNKPCAMYA